jgi:hypothetical protein
LSWKYKIDGISGVTDVSYRDRVGEGALGFGISFAEFCTQPSLAAAEKETHVIVACAASVFLNPDVCNFNLCNQPF